MNKKISKAFLKYRDFFTHEAPQLHATLSMLAVPLAGGAPLLPSMGGDALEQYLTFAHLEHLFRMEFRTLNKGVLQGLREGGIEFENGCEAVIEDDVLVGYNPYGLDAFYAVADSCGVSQLFDWAASWDSCKESGVKLLLRAVA
jgi:hypothetical protein